MHFIWAGPISRGSDIFSLWYPPPLRLHGVRFRITGRCDEHNRSFSVTETSWFNDELELLVATHHVHTYNVSMRLFVPLFVWPVERGKSAATNAGHGGREYQWCK